jgi:hypothetical protein
MNCTKSRPNSSSDDPGMDHAVSFEIAHCQHGQEEPVANDVRDGDWKRKCRATRENRRK